MIITVLCSSDFIRLYFQFVLSFLLICEDNSSTFLLIMKTKVVFGIILINCLASVRALLVLRLNTVYFMSK